MIDAFIFLLVPWCMNPVTNSSSLGLIPTDNFVAVSNEGSPFTASDLVIPGYLCEYKNSWFIAPDGRSYDLVFCESNEHRDKEYFERMRSGGSS